MISTTFAGTAFPSIVYDELELELEVDEAADEAEAADDEVETDLAAMIVE
jgi:hypothetical protein